MFQSLLIHMFPCRVAVVQVYRVITKKAFLKLRSFSFFLMSVLLIILGNLISSLSGNSKITFHKSAIYKKIGGLSHVSYPIS